MIKFNIFKYLKLLRQLIIYYDIMINVNIS